MCFIISIIKHELKKEAYSQQKLDCKSESCPVILQVHIRSDSLLVAMRTSAWKSSPTTVFAVVHVMFVCDRCRACTESKHQRSSGVRLSLEKVNTHN